MPAIIIQTSADSFQGDVVQSPVPVILDFGAPWCGPCKVMSPALLTVVETRHEKIRIAAVNVVELPELKTQFNIDAIPCFVLIVNGREVGRISEPSSIQQIIAWLEAMFTTTNQG